MRNLSTNRRVIKIPLKEKLKDKTILIISPDGALRLLPFEALYDRETQHYLIESREIRYIPSGKEFVRLHKYAKKRVSTNNRVVVFANPNFDSNESASHHEEQIALTRGTNENIIKPFFKESYSSLLGTEAEAKAIDTIMGSVEIFEGNRANETNLLGVKEPKILHIATHGFFINTPNIPNPMLKSGIVLSGVNHYAKRKQGYGRVTALKLSGLNLRSTDLVVLSACETGVVDVNDTDSISGLGKAFIQAGAKDVVMSLWSVDDNATKELMIDFYRGIKEHSNYARALREAKLKMIDEGRHPFYWGGFVLNGL
ncbi:MAG: CHAT domain-containing protein [Epsilonproteobacteria bacterium]|nr:CHAT domain-containing protein [Campylobacterota bacterium]